MCGQIFLLKKDGTHAAKGAAKRYQRQKQRGSSGFGYVSIHNGSVKNYQRATEEKDILAAMRKESAAGILFHHRYPTSIENLREAAHPIRVEHAELGHVYYVTHNGVIANDDEVKEKHESLGYKYTTEAVSQLAFKETIYQLGTKWNDSEALAIEVARLIEGKTEQVEARGSVAFIALQVKNNKNVALYYGRNLSNPLKIIEDKNHIAITSDAGGTMIEPNRLYRYDFKTGEITEKAAIFPVGYTLPAVGYGTGYGYTQTERARKEWDDFDYRENRTLLDTPKDRTAEIDKTPYGDDFITQWEKLDGELCGLEVTREEMEDAYRIASDRADAHAMIEAQDAIRGLTKEIERVEDELQTLELSYDTIEA